MPCTPHSTAPLTAPAELAQALLDGSMSEHAVVPPRMLNSEVELSDTIRCDTMRHHVI